MNNQPIPKRFLTAKELCKTLGVGRTTLWKWKAERGFPYHKAGKVVRYPVERVEAWLQKHTLGDPNLAAQPVSLTSGAATEAAEASSASGSPSRDERTVKHMLEEQTALLREIRDLLKAKRTLTMTLAGQP